MDKIKNPKADAFGFFMVETVGIEPTTPCMSSMYSNHLSYASMSFLSATLLLYHNKKKNAIGFKIIFYIFSAETVKSPPKTFIL